MLLHDHVPAYITWDQYLANQRQLLQNQRPLDNQRRHGRRFGTARWPRILWPLRPQDACQLPTDQARPLLLLASGAVCPNRRRLQRDSRPTVDDLVSRQVLQAITPAGIELSLSAIEHTSQNGSSRHSSCGRT